MLKYLNGYSNKKKAPNENYARELYELFTLGEGNGYTSTDITETSRALTGYNKYSNGNWDSASAKLAYFGGGREDTS